MIAEAKAAKKEEVKSRLRVKLKSYDYKVIDMSCHQIVDMAFRVGVKVIGPIPLPTETRKYTVNRATFVHKDSRDQFEMRVHKRLIEILNPNQKFIETLRDINLPAGVEISIKAT